MAPRRFNNFVARFWRGEFSLGISYWVFGFAGAFAAALVVAFVDALLSNVVEYEPFSVLAGFLTVWIGAGIITIWQLVGVWRSANGHIDRRIREGHTGGVWAALAKLAVVIGALRLLAAFAQSGIPQIVEASKMALLNDPDIPAYSIQVLANGTEIEVVGGFKYGLNDDLSRILQATPLVDVIHLDSLGGRIGEALKVYETIRDGGFTTYVSNKCLSACTIAFAGGRERWIASGAKLGFHAPDFPGFSPEQLGEASIDQQQTLIESGFDLTFVERALTTPHDGMWIPTSAELRRANVITGVATSDQFATSELSGDTSLKPTTAVQKDFIGSCLPECQRQGGDTILCTAYCGCMLSSVYGTDLWAVEALTPDQREIVNILAEQCGAETARRLFTESCVPECEGQRGDTTLCTAFCGCVFAGVYDTDLWAANELTLDQREREDALVGRCAAESQL